MTSMATVVKGSIDLTDALAQFNGKANICEDDAPIYIMGVEEDGSITGDLYTTTGVTNTAASGSVAEKHTVDGVKDSKNAEATNVNVMVDYYIDLPGEQVYEADITPDQFAGYYYVEADTLFRRQSDGVDMPANITIPNAKIQSNFTIMMASNGDPSTFDFVIDAFPGYTYFDKTKKVQAVLQIVDDTIRSASEGKPVMPHNEVIEHQIDGDTNDMYDSASNKSKFVKSTSGSSTVGG